MNAERIAQAFHEAYERLAPDHGYKTREASAVAWEDVPADNKNLMIATVRALIDQGVIPDRTIEVDRGQNCPACTGRNGGSFCQAHSWHNR
jgi:hypothetical protein